MHDFIFFIIRNLIPRSIKVWHRFCLTVMQLARRQYKYSNRFSKCFWVARLIAANMANSMRNLGITDKLIWLHLWGLKKKKIDEKIFFILSTLIHCCLKKQNKINFQRYYRIVWSRRCGDFVECFVDEETSSGLFE